MLTSSSLSAPRAAPASSRISPAPALGKSTSLRSPGSLCGKVLPESTSRAPRLFPAPGVTCLGPRACVCTRAHTAVHLHTRRGKHEPTLVGTSDPEPQGPFRRPFLLTSSSLSNDKTPASHVHLLVAPGTRTAVLDELAIHEKRPREQSHATSVCLQPHRPYPTRRFQRPLPVRSDAVCNTPVGVCVGGMRVCIWVCVCLGACICGGECRWVRVCTGVCACCDHIPWSSILSRRRPGF